MATITPDVITAGSYGAGVDYDSITILKLRNAAGALTGKVVVNAVVRKYNLAADGVTKVYSPLVTQMRENDLNAFLVGNSTVGPLFVAADAELSAAIVAYGQAKGAF